MKNGLGDLAVTLSLFPTDKGGRLGPTPNVWFGCLMVIDGKNFDVRLDLREVGSISPGQTVNVPVSFLDWEFAKDYCTLGKKFFLREVHMIGEGLIE